MLNFKKFMEVEEQWVYFKDLPVGAVFVWTTDSNAIAYRKIDDMHGVEGKTGNKILFTDPYMDVKQVAGNNVLG